MMLKKGEATGHISVIDTSKLPDERSMFYVPPFFKEYKKKRPFTRGGFQYQGSHEQSVQFAFTSRIMRINANASSSVWSGTASLPRQ
jgi:hypothetical protein